MRILITLLIFLTTFTACRDKIICPAFQSTYILDDSVRMAYYSYLWKIDEAERTKYLASRNTSSDTSVTASLIPSNKKDYFAQAGEYVVPEREVHKTKYGIVKYEPYWLKSYHLKTAPMENVLSPERPASYIQQDTTPVDTGEFYASDFNDSTTIDENVAELEEDTTQEAFVLPTLARAPPPPKKPETKFLYRYDPKDKALNVEQDYYNKYFGQYLLAQPPKSKPKPVEEKASKSDTTSLNSGQQNLVPIAGDSTDGAGFLNPKKGKKKDKRQKVEAVPEGSVPEEQPTEETIEKPKEAEPADPEDDGF